MLTSVQKLFKNLDQTPYAIRWKHFVGTTDVRKCLASQQELEEAKQVVDAHR